MTADPLSQRAKALLDAARDGLGPDDAAIARMRNNVLAGAGGIGVAAGSAKAGMSLAAKLTIVSVVVGAIGVGGWWVARGGDSPRAGGGGGASASAGLVAEAAPIAVTPPPAATSAPLTLSEAPQGPSRRVEPGVTAVSIDDAQAPGRRVHPANAAGAAKPHAKAPSLADEVALVDDAMSALRRDDPRAALAAADDHVARFGKRGQLAEEASAIRVESLCRLGDSRWSSALDAFDARWPRSAQRPRLTAACKGVQ